MDRWTIKQLNSTSAIQFARAILNERAAKVTPYSPLGVKLKETAHELAKLEGAGKDGGCGFSCDTEDCVNYKDGACGHPGTITIREHRCIGYVKRKPEYQYSLIAGIPPMLSEVYVTVGKGWFYPGRLLGYEAYGDNPFYKTYCVEVRREDGHRFVDFFRDIYSRREKKDDEE